MKGVTKRTGFVGTALIALVTVAGTRSVVAVPHPAPRAAVISVDGEQAESFADDALAFRHAQLVDTHGKIEPDAALEAAKDADRLRSTTSYQAESAVAGIARGAWTPIGPGNIGGRTRALVMHPTNPQVMWAASVGGGIWKTTDGGATWLPLDDFVASLRVSTLVIDPANPDVVYAGTGESFTWSSGDFLPGAGVFRTADGGRTWTRLASTAIPEFTYVNRVAISPASSSTLLAATESGIWRTTTAGAQTWTQGLAARVADLDFHPTNGNLAVAGGYGAAWYSENGGASWTAATGLPTAGRVEVAYARSSPGTVLASVDNNQGEIYRSIDGGKTYTKRTTLAYRYFAAGKSGQGNYDNALWVDPTNPNVVIVGGIDLWRSVDGGQTLTQISNWSSEQLNGDSAHADQHAIVEAAGFNGTTNATVVFANDGGLYRTANVYSVAQRSGWQNLNHNYGATQFYSGAGAPGGRIIGGTQDNGTPGYLSGANTDSWTPVFGGDGGYVAADPVNLNYVYGEYVYLHLFRSTNGGANRLTSDYIWGAEDAGGQCIKAAPYVIVDGCSSNSNFIAPFVMDPNNPQRILAGGGSLWRTDDARTANTTTTGPRWTAIKRPVTTGACRTGVSTDWTCISAIAVAPGNSNIVWVGYDNGLIYKTSNGTAAAPTWTRVDTAVMPGRWVLRLAIDPRNSDTVYAAFGGFAANNVWRTTDGGATWALRVGSGATQLPSAPVRDIAVNPNNSNWIYAATETGVFASTDAGATWAAPQDGPANVSVDQLFWIGTNLVAATHGRGMFFTDVNVPAPPNDDLADAQVLSGTTVTRTGDTTLGASREDGEPFHAEDNKGGASVWYSWTPTGSGPVTIDTRTSGFDTLLAVYTGSALGALTRVAVNDDEHFPDITTSLATFTATAGTTYRIAVDGFRFNNGQIAKGPVTLHLSQTVAAGNRSLVVNKAGTGAGTVTSAPAGIDCGADCAQDYADGTLVTLTASPASGSTFAGWSGDCTGAATCPVTMSAARTVTATFNVNAQPRTLTVTTSGAGTVTSAPAGIDCGATCAHDFPDGTAVTLTATAAAGSTFAGWTGNCTGIVDCQVTMNAAKAVTATFTVVAQRSLTVTKAGTGTGMVSSAPAGIDCGADCTESYADGTLVVLTANAAVGSTFAGWSGDCTGANATCAVTMNAAKAVTARFDPGQTAPANDGFASAAVVTPPGVDAGNAGASRESGEPIHAGNLGGASVWWDYTAPASGQVTLDTRTSTFDTLLAVYTGTALGTLALVESNDDEDYDADVVTSRLTFVAHAGVHYRIAVDGYNYNGTGAEQGDVHLHLAFAADATPPTNPQLTSPTHPAGVWTAQSRATVAWSGAADAGTGVDGYSIAWDGGPAEDVPAGASQSTRELADGVHSFVLRTRDGAGNVSAPVTFGPLRVDVTPPSTGLVTSTTHIPGLASSANAVTVLWSTASDAASGVDGYSFAWDLSPSTEVDTTKELEEAASTATSPPLGAGTYWFHVRTRDNAGNWSTTTTLGPFVITTPPFGGGGGGGSTGGGGSGPDQAVVRCVTPRVLGKTLAQARSALKKAHCQLGKVTRARSRTIKRGRVIRQSPRAGTRRASGAKIALVLSRGRR